MSGENVPKLNSDFETKVSYISLDILVFSPSYNSNIENLYLF